jgi:methyl-accepting chemotaxis protein
MPRNLRAGANLMRFFQISSLVIAVSGAIAAATKLNSGVPPEIQGFVKTALLLFTLIAVMLAVLVWMLFRRNLAKRINDLSATLLQVTGGDLTARAAVTAQDEMGQLADHLNIMLDKFEALIAGIGGIAMELTNIARQNSDAALAVVAATQVQSDSIESASAAVNGIISAVDGVSNGVVNLSGSAEINSTSIAEIATSIAEVRKNVGVQSESIDEVSSSIIEMTAVMEEINGNVKSLMEASTTTISSLTQMDAANKQVEENAKETAFITDDVLQGAEQGRASVEATITGINEIRNSSRSTFASITTLSERVSAIGGILSVIDDVAEQTNLLALNSAIIAAQAGEHGKGFAVVAGEIKGLADRTRQSTMEITSLINGVQAETAKAVTAIRVTEEKVLEGENLSKRSGDALEKVLTGVRMAAGRVNEIARATVEQAQGGMYIHGAMRHVADMVAQIARSCQESTRTNSSIMTAVERMKSFTAHVTKSAADQQQIGADIAGSTVKMAEDISRIKDACLVQSESSLQIVTAIDTVRESTQSNLVSAKTMEREAKNLLEQIDILRTEIRQMQLSGRKGSQ